MCSFSYIGLRMIKLGQIFQCVSSVNFGMQMLQDLTEITVTGTVLLILNLSLAVLNYCVVKMSNILVTWNLQFVLISPISHIIVLTECFVNYFHCLCTYTTSELLNRSSWNVIVLFLWEAATILILVKIKHSGPQELRCISPCISIIPCTKQIESRKLSNHHTTWKQKLLLYLYGIERCVLFCSCSALLKYDSEAWLLIATMYTSFLHTGAATLQVWGTVICRQLVVCVLCKVTITSLFMLLLTLALDRGEWSASCPGCLVSMERSSSWAPELVWML